MSGKFGVEPTTVQAAAQHVDEVDNQIQSQLPSLLNGLEPLGAANITRLPWPLGQQ